MAGVTAAGLANSASAAAADRARARNAAAPIWPILLVFYATLLPRELRLEIGPLTLFADRLALIPVLPFLALQLLRGKIRLVLPDMLVVLAGLWMILAMSTHYGIAGGLERGGSLDDVRRVLVLMAPGIFLAGLTVMAESLWHRHFVQLVSEQVFGRLPSYAGGDVAGIASNTGAQRFGLLRGKGPFPHAILAGLYLAALIPVYNMAGLRGWPRVLGNLASMFSIFTLSSTALLALVLSWALLFYDWLQRRVRELNWRLLIVASSAFAAMLQLASNSGVAGLIGRYLSFDSQTYYFRTLIWRYGLQSVEKHPWFGIGFAGYERPGWMITESIDAHWLLLAVRFGLPPALALFAATVLAIAMLGHASKHARRVDQRFFRGMAIALFVMLMAMFSVAIWSSLQTLFNLLLGGCVACTQQSRALQSRGRRPISPSPDREPHATETAG
ncbi:MAG: O-antigen ligase family protein [Novosphingobium sp.]